MIHTPEMPPLLGSYPKLDLGCGPNKQPGFIGIDKIHFPGVDVVADLTKTPWPLAADSAEEVYCSHFLEHLTNFEGKWERVRFFNELHRVMKPGATARLIFPHWCSTRYYGDPTHREPFSEMGFYYLRRLWRVGGADKCPQCQGRKCPACGQTGEINVPANAPHADAEHNPHGYSCDFEAVWGFSMHPSLAVRTQEFQQFATSWYKEAQQDIIATLTKR